MKSGFTLAEVLITISIIGIVAALTLPSLIQKKQNDVIITSLKKSYSELQNITNLISNDCGLDITYIVEQNNDEQLKEIFMGYYDNAADCTDNICFAKQDIKYYTYTHSTLSTNVYFSRYRFISKDGRLFIFGGRGTYPDGSDYNYGQIITVDVNGPFKGPNAWGRDTFSFRIVDKQIKPCGGLTLCSNIYNYNCNSSDKTDYSGIGCAYYALTKKDFLDKKYYYDRYAREL